MFVEVLEEEREGGQSGRACGRDVRDVGVGVIGYVVEDVQYTAVRILISYPAESVWIIAF